MAVGCMNCRCNVEPAGVTAWRRSRRRGGNAVGKRPLLSASRSFSTSQQSSGCSPTSLSSGNLNLLIVTSGTQVAPTEDVSTGYVPSYSPGGESSDLCLCSICQSRFIERNTCCRHSPVSSVRAGPLFCSPPRGSD